MNVKRLLVRIGIGIVGLIALGGIVVFAASQSLFARKYSFSVRAPAVPTDAAAIARGEHLERAVLDCGGCHAVDHGGMEIISSGALGHINGGNLTRGRGSIVAGYTDEDWARAIRHGVDRTGRGLLFMSSDAYASLSERDLGDTIAYLKSLPPVDRELPRSSAGPIGRLLFLIGALPLTAAKLDHQKIEQAATPVAGPTAEYGRYLAETSGCLSCHGANLAGRSLGPNVRSLNITPAAIGSWSEAEFEQSLRKGISPGPRKLSPMMPSERAFSQLTDEEVKALWLWVRTVPSVPVAK